VFKGLINVKVLSFQIPWKILWLNGTL